MKCPACDVENRGGSKFCKNCGSEIKTVQNQKEATIQKEQNITKITKKSSQKENPVCAS